jgi:hypothetical protein
MAAPPATQSNWRGGAEIDTETLKHDICDMKNVTITLPDDVARRARVEAARQDKSLSRFVADLLAERCGSEQSGKLALLREFFEGPGFPGIRKAWPGREALYGEREDELLRRYESHRLHTRSAGTRETPARDGFSDVDHQSSHADSQRSKPQRMLSRRNRTTRPDAKK